jgi:hypothetical protein
LSDWPLARDEDLKVKRVGEVLTEGFLLGQSKLREGANSNAAATIYD